MKAQSILTAATAAAERPAVSYTHAAQQQEPLVSMGLEQLLLSDGLAELDGSLLALKWHGQELRLASVQHLTTACCLPRHQQLGSASSQPDAEQGASAQPAVSRQAAVSQQLPAQSLKMSDMHFAVSVQQVHVWAGDAAVGLAAALARDTALTGPAQDVSLPTPKRVTPLHLTAYVPYIAYWLFSEGYS